MSINLNELSQTLTGKSSVIIPIEFRPTREINYEEILTFIVDSSIEENVKITGEGIGYKVRARNF